MPLSNLLDTSLLYLKSQHEKTQDIREITNVFISDSNIVVEFVTNTKNTTKIKILMSDLMSFLQGLFKGEYDAEFIQNFAVKAYDTSGAEVMYCITSKSVAYKMAEGDATSWLKGTIFVENTPESRLIEAKQKISEIENSIRKTVIRELSSKHGTDWWSLVVPEDVKESASAIYFDNNKELTTDAEKLINSTTLIQLHSIVSSNWNDFSSIFEGFSKTKLRKKMGSLNNVRKDEAHNREISSTSLNKLREHHNSFMSKISNKYPDLVDQYLFENWRKNVEKIFSQYKLNTIAEGKSLEENLEVYRKNDEIYEDMVLRLNSLTVPVSQKENHATLLGLVSNTKSILLKMSIYAKKNNLEDLKKSIEEHQKISEDIASFIRKILFEHS